MASDGQPGREMRIIDAVQSDKGFKSYFTSLRTWESWFTFLKVLQGSSKLKPQELELLQECTGLTEAPKEPIKEAYVIAGRRSGKSTICALLAVFYAVWGGWEKYTSKGEKPRVFVIGTNKAQSRIIMGYIKAFLSLNTFLKGMVRKSLSESIELRNGVEIVVKPASWRSSRGFTVGMLILEELAFWRFEEESATRDKEIYVAIKPGTTSIKNSLIVGISTPFARQGLLWSKFRKHYGKPGSTLIWQAPTWTMNKTLTEHDLEKEYLETLGEAEYGAEYCAKFREDIEGYLPLETIDKAIVKNRMFLPPDPEVERYYAFCDPSEGVRKGGDSMTLAISHPELVEDTEDKVYVLDYIFEAIPPFNNNTVISEIALICKKYNVSEIVQDRHAIGWISKDLEPYDIIVEASDKTKSEIYEYFAVLMNKNEVELLDEPRLKSQITGLQRILKSGGLVKIDHYRGGHDDLINSAAGSIILSSEEKQGSTVDIMVWG
ncbi:MAG: hypothetical protein HQ555_07770 [Candidatus Aminicenantes bacterium]|nr:hypothetical protein [Candidatus Aminicenantes bacterium]